MSNKEGHLVSPLRGVLLLGSVLFALSVSSCFGGDDDDDDSVEAPDAGADAGGCGGHFGCECVLEGEPCAGALSCIEGVCQPQGCGAGKAGCACAQGERCLTSNIGEQLVCLAGMCTYPGCTAAGETACPCIDAQQCSAGDAACSNGICVLTDCLPGESHCECLGGTCDPMLICRDDTICVAGAGFEGGPCLQDGTCNRRNRCDELLNVCVACELGEQGCQCTDGGGCGSGLVCWNDLCLTEDQVPPAEPLCYTPCSSDLVTDTETRTCDSDGLLPGCIGDKTCVDGSCMDPGGATIVCDDDIDCPFYQTCLQGKCYSNCEGHSDCPPDRSCYKKVCRLPCQSTSGAETCPDGFFCAAHDGENGHCTPLADPADQPGQQPTGGFALDLTGVEFSNIAVSGSFQIQPEGERSESYTIRKLGHTATMADGSVVRVEAPRDLDTGEYLPCDAAAGQCPLDWLEMAFDGDPTRDPTLEVEALAGCGDSCPVISLGNAGGTDAVRWQGELEVSSPNGRTTLLLTYVERPEGRWSGTMYYFGNFSDKGVEQWLGRDDLGNVDGVDNGLLRRWGAFRQGNLNGGWEEMKAVLTATRTESWRYGAVKHKCREVNSGSTTHACYPFSNEAGVRTYVNDWQTFPIPTGAVEFPIAMNLRAAGSGGNSRQIAGRIETALSLHYAANPAVALKLEADPADSGACSSAITSDCVVFLEEFSAEINVGGRFVSDSTSACGAGYEKTAFPWLVPGFTAATEVDGDTGLCYRYECLDGELPYDVSYDADLLPLNTSLAWANPVPDGAPRPRTLRLLDGALVNQSELVILFEESFDSFVDTGAQAISAYGYMVLKRQPADIDPTDGNDNGITDAFEGTEPPAELQKTVQAHLGLQCEQELLEQIGLGDPGDMPSDLAGKGLLNELVEMLLTGNQSAELIDPLVSDRLRDDVVVHYLCEDTGLFNGGEDDRGGTIAGADAGVDGGVGPGMDGGGDTDVRIACPAGSRVTFFVVKDPEVISGWDVAEADCQQDVVCDAAGCTGGTCQQTLNQWRSNGLVQSWEPYWRCSDPNQVYCDDDRMDLRNGKQFFAPPDPASGAVFLPLRPAMADAFRYKIRFQSRTGAQVGFAPEICLPDSDQIPYCYDPGQIEQIRSRIDCLVAVYTDDDLYAALDDTWDDELDAFLRGSFSRFEDGRDGFERLFTELLIMLGDESLTRAFASRFDLAGAGGASFQGSFFESGGIDLSGVAGFEMYLLYQAIQYYQTALDRGYLMGPNIAEAMTRGSSDSERNFISPETVVLYFDRLIRASTQKARAWSEVAKNYQNFNRPGLARAVIERAYTSTYLESVILSELMWDIAENSRYADQAQITLTVEDAQKRYRMALLDMRDVYSSITDDVNYFGFAPDYVPFPALDAGNVRDTNAFEVMLGIAQSRVLTARQREDQALAANRSYNTDAAQFQAELVRIRNNYENQLADICGTFEGIDGNVYPATEKYADLDEYATLLGDPCGRMGNGQIHNSMVEYEQSLLQQKLLQTRFENVLAEVEIERQRVSDQCKLTMKIADFQYQQAGRVMALNAAMESARITMESINRKIGAAAAFAQAAMCVPEPLNPGRCGEAVADGAIALAAAGAQDAVTLAGSTAILAMQQEVADVERQTARWVTQSQCQAAMIDSNARTLTLLLQIKEIEIEALKQQYQSQLVLSEIVRNYNNARRRLTEQEEAEQLLINVEAARNDPNIRIYRNDAVINADISFNDALRAVYRATKVFEYYTSQSYERLDQLFLIRMVGAGDYNLENYLVQLQNEYFEFEELFGVPDTRVAILSLRDDIMRIPFLDENGQPLSQGARIDKMRARLGSVDLLNSSGYLTVPFGTSLDSVSPLTRNHKVLYIEADIVGSDVGDTVGRLYLGQAGTGVVRNIADEIDYYVFPERTAVINPYFNGNRVFEPQVYRNHRLRGRPLVNTAWELFINQRDEIVNKDIDLQSLSDIRLFVYYTDFTAL